VKRAKPITRYRLHGGDQIPTRSVTIVEIMSAPMFELGVADVRADRGYPLGYDLWGDTNDRWDYERGRQWARLAPRHLKLKIDGKVTVEALRLYSEDIL
jgi:hypothetical protein